jgi:RecB family exonuclease
MRDDPTARALLTLVDTGIERVPLTAATASELLLGPFGGLDPLGLRKLRLALRAEDIAGGGSARADDLLVDALGNPARLATIDHRVGRAAAKLATTLEKLRESDGSIEELLWLAWSRSGLAEVWYTEALGSGAGAAEANRRLDGVVALFTTAKRFAERRPNDPPSVFLSELLDAEVPEDSLSPRSVDDAVVVATPAAMVGREFDTVVVAGLQEGAWPNLRLRGSLLAPHELVRVVLGIDSASIDERRVVRDDELRMFALAVSRARTRLVVAAVGNDDEAVSPFFQLVAALARPIDASSPPPFSLRGVTGRLRRILAEPAVSARDRVSAASTLAALAAEGVPGADPSQWHGLLPISTTQRLFEGEPAPVRPSSIDKLEKSALDWFLESVARTDPGMAANVGTIMHSALELAETTDANDLWKTVESRWSELAFESQWLEERQRRQMWKFTVALAEYLQDFETSGHRAVAAEGRFEVTIGDAIVRGSIDRVEVSGSGAVVIVDLKTGTPIYKKDVETHPQLAVYQLAYAEGALDEFLLEVTDHTGGGAKLLFVKRGAEGKQYSQAHQATFDAAQLEAFRDRVKVAAGIVAESSFRGVADVVGIFESHALLRLHRVLAVSSD